MATSLTYEVYRLMPNDTDLTVYKQHGMAGWNFAFVGGLSYYHSPEDTPANLDPRTLQHQGENLLSMARHLVRLDLDDVRRDDVVYFSILQRFVAIYPLSWVMPLLGNAALAYAAVLALGVAKGRVRLAEVAAGFATFLAALLAAMMAVSVLWVALGGLLVRTGIVVNRPDLRAWRRACRSRGTTSRCCPARRSWRSWSRRPCSPGRAGGGRGRGSAWACSSGGWRRRRPRRSGCPARATPSSGRCWRS